MKCELCPRRCGVDRAEGGRGYCGAGADVEVYRWGAHDGEEPPVSGARGSGTVFFSRCTLRCLYCQNYPWSQEGAGRKMPGDVLTAVFRELREAGCHNWNLVSPTPWLPAIREALAGLEGARLPLVYNTSGFERPETLREYADLADVFLTDLRYARAETAREGSDAEGYVKVAREALLEMWRLRGPLRLSDEGVALSGTICRVLVLPGRAEEAVENLRWLAERVGTEIAVSVMSQYLPAHRATRSGSPWNRKVTAAEYETVCRAMDECGFSEGWVQEFEAATPAELVGYQMPPGEPTM